MDNLSDNAGKKEVREKVQEMIGFLNEKFPEKEVEILVRPVMPTPSGGPQNVLGELNPHYPVQSEWGYNSGKDIYFHTLPDGQTRFYTPEKLPAEGLRALGLMDAAVVRQPQPKAEIE